MTETHNLWVNFDECEIADFRIVTASRDELAEAMVADCLATKPVRDSQRPRIIFDVNGHAISMRATDADYRETLSAADVTHADGGFIVSLSQKWFKRPIKERSATTDMIHDCAQAAQKNGLSFFLLGGTEDVNAKCTALLQEQYPDLIIAGRRNGYFTAEEEPSVIEEINATGADIIWVGLGKPKEQAFCKNWKDTLKGGWVITCGGCYNYITGDYPRAPQWMQDNNLEWLHRMATNPRKLFWRYAVTTPHALFLALTRPRREID